MKCGSVQRAVVQRRFNAANVPVCKNRNILQQAFEAVLDVSANPINCVWSGRDFRPPDRLHVLKAKVKVGRYT